MTTPTTLTAHLYSLSTLRPYAAATEHAFLAAAGRGTLPTGRLSLWLAQDRLYAAHTYPRFIGRLIASIPFSSFDAPASAAERRNQRILDVLVYALQNVTREVRFFGDTAAQFGLDLEGWRERKGTKEYRAEMVRVSAEGTLEDGLVYLWAMERAYLDAWLFARSHAPHATAAGPTTGPVAAFMENWTNDEFVRFVDDLADIVNSLGIEPGSSAWRRAEEVWARVVEVEEGFWPEEGEEDSMRLPSAHKNV